MTFSVLDSHYIFNISDKRSEEDFIREGFFLGHPFLFVPNPHGSFRLGEETIPEKPDAEIVFLRFDIGTIIIVNSTNMTYLRNSFDLVLCPFTRPSEAIRRRRGTHRPLRSPHHIREKLQVESGTFQKPMCSESLKQLLWCPKYVATSLNFFLLSLSLSLSPCCLLWTCSPMLCHSTSRSLCPEIPSLKTPSHR